MAAVEVLASKPQQRFEHVFGAPALPQDHRAIGTLDPDIKALRTQRLELIHRHSGGYDPAIGLGLYCLVHFPAAGGGAAELF
jgi:hypothetical protein